jgi:hypothetical protein
MEADQMETRARHQQRGQALHEFQRRHDYMGGAIFVRTLQDHAEAMMNLIAMYESGQSKTYWAGLSSA